MNLNLTTPQIVKGVTSSRYWIQSYSKDVWFQTGDFLAFIISLQQSIGTTWSKTCVTQVADKRN